MWDQPHPGPFDHAPWWQPLETIVPLILFVLLIGVIVWAVLRTTRQRPVAITPSSSTPSIDPALGHARMRYAQGEIDRDEFQRLAQDLSGDPSGGPTPSTSPPP